MRLVDYPFVVVRFRCDHCKRSGQSKLARLAEKYGCMTAVDALAERIFRDRPWRKDGTADRKGCGIYMPDPAAKDSARHAAWNGQTKGRGVMVRYKGRPSAKAISKTHPYVVEIKVPEAGLGKQKSDMASWHDERGLRQMNGPGRYQDGVWYVRSCFSTQEYAKAFCHRFDGRVDGDGADLT